jgi:hypothetical protein
MDERRRFQIALGGVASTVFIAGVFVWSAPPLEYPAVRAPQPFVRVVNAGPDRPTFQLEGFGMPEPAEARHPRRRRPAPPVLQGAAFAELVATGPTTPPAAEAAANGAMPLATRGPRLVLTSAPAARGGHVGLSVRERASAAHDAGDRGALTGVIAIAGKEVGRGLRTAGRAIKSIF